MMLKISDSDLKAVGAANADEFTAKLVEKLTAVANSGGDVTAQLAKITENIKGLSEALAKVKPGELTAEEIKKLITEAKDEAKAEASRTAAEIYGKTGRAPAVEAGTATEDIVPQGAKPMDANIKSLIAAGKYAEAHANSPALQAEWPDMGTIKGADMFASYHKAVSKGRVAILENQAQADQWEASGFRKPPGAE